jgi:hypothetical protein
VKIVETFATPAPERFELPLRTLVLIGESATRDFPRLVGHVRAVVGATIARTSAALGLAAVGVDEFTVRLLADEDVGAVAAGLERGSVRHDLDAFDLEVAWRSPTRSYELTCLAEVTAAVRAMVDHHLDDGVSDPYPVRN